MFSRLVEEYDLVVPTRQLKAYDALIDGRINEMHDTLEVFENMDQFVSNELHLFWAHAAREMSSYERNRTLELAERFCPCRDFWRISIMGRLHDPKLVFRYLEYELMMLKKCDVSGLKWEYAADLITVFERAYTCVLETMGAYND